MENTNYVIIGAGPAGLTAALLLANSGKKVTIIDENNSIGGCHRVTRVDGYFSEHGPRVYSSAYKTFYNLLQYMGLDFNKLFTPYKFNISTIGGESILNIGYTEMLPFLSALWRPKQETENISMLEFVKNNNFSKESVDYIDRLCRLTDGAGISRYSLWKFLQLANQQAAYKLYQPKSPNDVGLFRLWGTKLKELGVKIILNKKISSIGTFDTSKTWNVYSDSSPREQENQEENEKQEKICSCDVIIMAIPPNPMFKILTKSGIANNFGFDQNWVTNTKYLYYPNVVFYWDTDVLKNVDRVWGFPKSEMGLAHIVLSDYFNYDFTMISTCATRYSSNTSKTPDVEKFFSELKLSYPNLPLYSKAIISTSNDTAYISSATDSRTIPYKGIKENLYNIGTHNGNCEYAFTSLESAVCNAVEFVAQETKNEKYRELIDEPFTLKQIFILTCILLLVLIVILACAKNYTENIMTTRRTLHV